MSVGRRGSHKTLRKEGSEAGSDCCGSPAPSLLYRLATRQVVEEKLSKGMYVMPTFSKDTIKVGDMIRLEDEMAFVVVSGVYDGNVDATYPNGDVYEVAYGLIAEHSPKADAEAPTSPEPETQAPEIVVPAAMEQRVRDW